MVFGSPSSGHGKDEGLPERTKHRVLMSGNNHTFIQHESKGTSEEEIQDKVMKRLTIQQAIPYQYANNPKMMEYAIHYLTKWEFRCIGGVCVFYITSVVYISSTIARHSGSCCQQRMAVTKQIVGLKTACRNMGILG